MEEIALAAEKVFEDVGGGGCPKAGGKMVEEELAEFECPKPRLGRFEAAVEFLLGLFLLSGDPVTTTQSVQ